MQVEAEIQASLHATPVKGQALFLTAASHLIGGVAAVLGMASTVKRSDTATEHQAHVEALMEKQALAMSGGRMASVPVPPQQRQLGFMQPRSEAAMPRQATRKICNLWDGQRCHFAECFPTKLRCELEMYHVPGVNTFDKAFYDRIKTKPASAPAAKP